MVGLVRHVIAIDGPIKAVDKITLLDGARPH